MKTVQMSRNNATKSSSSNGRNNTNSKDNDTTSAVSGRSSKDSPALEIDFGESLRLLKFQDLMKLFETCRNSNISIINLDNDKISHLLSNAMNISSKQ